MGTIQTIAGENMFEKTVLTPVEETFLSSLSRISLSIMSSLIVAGAISSSVDFDPLPSIVLTLTMPMMFHSLLSPFKSFTAPTGVNAHSYTVTKRQLKKMHGRQKTLETVMIERPHGYMIPDGQTIGTSDNRLTADSNFKVEESFVTIGNKVYVEQKISFMPLPLWEHTFDDIMALEAIKVS